MFSVYSVVLILSFILFVVIPDRVLSRNFAFFVVYTLPADYQPRAASSRARRIAEALFRVSWYSISGLESATIPAPAWK